MQSKERAETRTLAAHGDWIGHRQLATATILKRDLDWPGGAQACRIEVEVRKEPKTAREVSHALISVPRAQADAATLLSRHRAHRAHRGIEDRVHRVRDVPMGADQNQTRADSRPQVRATVRSAAISHMRALGSTNITVCAATHWRVAQGPIQLSNRMDPGLQYRLVCVLAYCSGCGGC